MARSVAIIVLLFICTISLSSRAEEGISIVAVGEADTERSKIAFLNVENKGALTSKEKIAMEEFMVLLSNDFSFYKKAFHVIPPNRLTKSPGVPNYRIWKRKGFSVINKVYFTKRKSLRYKIETYSINSEQKMFEKEGILHKNRVREIGHSVAHDLFLRLTGKVDSIFKSKIVFVSDIAGPNRGEPVKELYIMDFDGYNKKRLTRYRGTVISPALSHDGRKVLYSLIKNKNRKNVNLYVMDLSSRKSRLLSSRRGLNSGAVFTGDGKNILMTLSHTGNAEIFMMNLRTKKLRQITKHYAPDVDPSISRSGDKLTFLSGRPGKPMIYTADPRGMERGVERISFVGKFNATPRFSPDGKEIAFSSWLDNRFDIFRIDSNGRNLSRLTKDFGSNEDPTYSNDGQFLAFSSQRVLSSTKAVHNIYIMDREGDIYGSVTKNFGNCISPRWSK